MMNTREIVSRILQQLLVFLFDNFLSNFFYTIVVFSESHYNIDVNYNIELLKSVLYFSP